MLRLVPGLCLVAVACGGPPAPKGPGTEPTDTTEQTSKAGPKRTWEPPAPSDEDKKPDADDGDGKRFPPTYDLKLVPRCQSKARGSKPSAPLKNFVGIKEPDLVTAYGPPSCIYRGLRRYEFRKEPCPEYVDTIEIKVRGGAVVDQKTYRRSTGVSCE